MSSDIIELCSSCDGSGEGRHDGTTCVECSGTGMEWTGEDSWED
jgi:DnaJ-class molecular chaperone